MRRYDRRQQLTNGGLTFITIQAALVWDMPEPCPNRVDPGPRCVLECDNHARRAEALCPPPAVFSEALA